MLNKRASFARATRVVVHLILALGPSALGMGKVTRDNHNLSNLSKHTKYIYSMLLTISDSGSTCPITPAESL